MMTGDGDFEAFYTATYDRLVGQLLVVVGSLEEAEDVVQEAFVRACGRWSHVRDYEVPEAWVRRVALNLASSGLRRARRRAALLVRLGPAADVPALSVDAVALTRTLRKLPLRGREALVLHQLAGAKRAGDADPHHPGADQPWQDRPVDLGAAPAARPGAACGGPAWHAGLHGGPAWGHGRLGGGDRIAGGQRALHQPGRGGLRPQRLPDHPAARPARPGAADEDGALWPEPGHRGAGAAGSGSHRPVRLGQLVRPAARAGRPARQPAGCHHMVRVDAWLTGTPQ